MHDCLTSNGINSLWKVVIQIDALVLKSWSMATACFSVYPQVERALPPILYYAQEVGFSNRSKKVVNILSLWNPSTACSKGVGDHMPFAQFHVLIAVENGAEEMVKRPAPLCLKILTAHFDPML